jgi:hypothetical protein
MALVLSFAKVTFYGLKYLFLSFFLSFCLIKKKQKIKKKRQLQLFSPAKSLRSAAEKIVVHTVSSDQPHYYQRMQ